MEIQIDPTMSYRELQAIAKKLHLPGNLKYNLLVDIIQARRGGNEDLVQKILAEQKQERAKRKSEKLANKDAGYRHLNLDVNRDGVRPKKRAYEDDNHPDYWDGRRVRPNHQSLPNFQAAHSSKEYPHRVQDIRSLLSLPPEALKSLISQTHFDNVQRRQINEAVNRYSYSGGHSSTGDGFQAYQNHVAIENSMARYPTISEVSNAYEHFAPNFYGANETHYTVKQSEQYVTTYPIANHVTTGVMLPEFNILAQEEHTFTCPTNFQYVQEFIPYAQGENVYSAVGGQNTIHEERTLPSPGSDTRSATETDYYESIVVPSQSAPVHQDFRTAYSKLPFPQYFECYETNIQPNLYEHQIIYEENVEDCNRQNQDVQILQDANDTSYQTDTADNHGCLEQSFKVSDGSGTSFETNSSENSDCFEQSFEVKDLEFAQEIEVTTCSNVFEDPVENYIFVTPNEK